MRLILPDVKRDQIRRFLFKGNLLLVVFLELVLSSFYLFVLISSEVLYMSCKYSNAKFSTCLNFIYMMHSLYQLLLLLLSVLIPLPEYISANIFPNEFFKLMVTSYYLLISLFSKCLFQTVVQRCSNSTTSGIKLTAKVRHTLKSSVLSDN